MKICTTCNQCKSLTDFYKRSASRNTRQHNCKECAKLLTRAWRKNNPNMRHQATLRTKAKTKYGLTLEQLHKELELQEGLCKICKRQISFDATEKANKPHVDHNHNTLQFRGLLCLTCNTGLGMFGDNPNLLDIASNYLKANVQPERLSELASNEDAIVRSHRNNNYERSAEMTDPVH